MTDEELRALERTAATTGDRSVRRLLAYAYKRAGDDRWKAIVDALANELLQEIRDLLEETHRHPDLEPLTIMPFAPDGPHPYALLSDREPRSGSGILACLLRGTPKPPEPPPAAPC